MLNSDLCKIEGDVSAPKLIIKCHNFEAYKNPNSNHQPIEG